MVSVFLLTLLIKANKETVEKLLNETKYEVAYKNDAAIKLFFQTELIQKEGHVKLLAIIDDIKKGYEELAKTKKGYEELAKTTLADANEIIKQMLDISMYIRSLDEKGAYDFDKILNSAAFLIKIEMGLIKIENKEEVNV